MADWTNNQKWDLSLADNARRVAAQKFAIALCENVLPLLSAVSEHEQIQALTIEAERFLKAYEGHLNDACDALQRIAKESLDTTIKPLMFKR